MRVIRRSSLSKLYPLPDGLHFTPAMSCRAMLDDRIKLSELDMDYEERIGASKLSVIKDGFRFLGVILDTALTYRPFRMFGLVALLLLALAGALGASIAYAKWVSPGYAHLPRWYLLRMLTALTAAASGLVVATVGLVAERVALMTQRHQPPEGILQRLILRPLRSRWISALGAGAVLFGVGLNLPVLREWVVEGHIEIDTWWSYVVTGAFCVVTGVQFLASGIADRMSDLLDERLRALEALREAGELP